MVAYFNGYLEGRGAIQNISSGIVQAYGIEVVYDFVHLQRAVFTYAGNQNQFAKGVCTSLTTVGTTFSAYAGAYHFPYGKADIRQGYEGWFGILGTEASANIPLPVPLPSPLSVGLNANLFASVNPSEGILVPGADITNLGWGASMGIEVAGGGLALPLSAGFEVLWVQYSMLEGTEWKYSDAETMAQDILNGTYSEIPGARNNTGVAGLQDFRRIAADRVTGRAP